MEQINETLGGLIIILGMVAIVYIIARYRYMIKKLMIEKGVMPPSGNSKSRLIDAGCMFFFLGIGVLVSAYYTTLDLTEDTLDLLMWGTILIIGSFGPIAAYLIRKNYER